METLDRRQFLAGTVMATVSAGLGRAAEAPMKLSLSCRMGEGERTRTEIKTAMPFEELVQIAKDTGYQGLCIRGSFANMDSTGLYRLHEMSRLVKAAGLKVTSAMPDVAMGLNNDHALATRATYGIGPYLDYCEIFGTDMIRIMIWKEEELALAQRAADEARERRIRIAPWSHGNTLFATPAGALDALKKINRPNFGFCYEPSQWTRVEPRVDHVEIARTFKPWLWNVQLNNPGGVGGAELGLWEDGPVNTTKVFEGLYAVGYTEWVTVFSTPIGTMTRRESASKTLEFLKPLAQRMARGTK